MIAHAKFTLRRWVVRALRFMRLHLHQPRWLVRPPNLEGCDVCVLASYSADGALGEHTLALCRAWKAQGFVVILVVAAAFGKTPRATRETEGIDGLLVRPNIGYDFGSWAATLARLPDVRRANLVALANDSVYGPLAGFDRMLDRVRSSTAAIVGLTDSVEIRHHLQSFLVFYTRDALASRVVDAFWSRVPLGGREDVIANRELQFLEIVRAAQVDVEILFPVDRGFTGNPTLERWRSLLDDGFPFVKVQLLRDNPKGADLDGWQDTLRGHGYDPDRVRRHLGPGFAASAAAKQAVTNDE